MFNFYFAINGLVDNACIEIVFDVTKNVTFLNQIREFHTTVLLYSFVRVDKTDLQIL